MWSKLSFVWWENGLERSRSLLLTELHAYYGVITELSRRTGGCTDLTSDVTLTSLQGNGLQMDT